MLESDIRKTGSLPDSLPVQTLCDFVDEESVSELNERAEYSFEALKVRLWLQELL